MIEDALLVIRVGEPGEAGETREGKAIGLVVVVDAAGSGREREEALAGGRAGADELPNYWIDQDGAVRQFVDDERAGGAIGLAIHERRRRNIDRVAVSVRLERPEGRNYSDPQVAALHGLLAELRGRHGLDVADLATVLADDEGRPRAFPYLQPAPPLEETGEILGAAPDPAQELWAFLYGEAWKPRGGGLKLNQAFARYAAKFGIGAPLAPNQPPPVSAGASYNYQVFARDTIFNEGDKWAQVQALSAHVDEERAIPESGLVPAMLRASYDAAIKQTQAKLGALQGNTSFMPGWRFHFVAMAGRLGPALSGNYRYTGADQPYAFQVFAGDTLYTPISEPAGCRYLSTTEASHPAYHKLWEETYRYAGAPYDPASPFQQRAAADRLGSPLTGVYEADHAGTRYRVQVFALDTLYAGPDGQVRRASELPLLSEVQSYQPQPAPPPPPAPAPKPSPAGEPRRDYAWPPPPDFPPLFDHNGARARALGTIEWVRADGDNIRITNGWAEQNIVEVFIPQLAKIAGGQGGKVRFHRRAKDQLVRLWAAWEAAGLLRLVLRYFGDWVPRTIRRNPSALSNHAYGTAFDINAEQNGFWKPAALVGDKGSVRELVPIAHQHGFYWGGHFIYDKKTQASDGMHFEWAVER